ncbi:hypothetical protein NMG60_11037310 [Bertholletia excelsa]
MGGHVLYLYSSRRAAWVKRLSAFFPSPIRRYTKDSMEKAPTVAEEFERVAEAKSRQGFTSQTVEKARDGTEEAGMGESSTKETVKGKYKEPVGKGDFHETGNEQRAPSALDEED